MWSRFSNLAQNVQDKLDTVVDNVNKSLTEEEAAAAAAAAAAAQQAGSETPSKPEGAGDASFQSATDSSFISHSDAEDQLLEQNKLISQLKDMIREKDAQLRQKETDMKENNAKMSKFKLQAKAKISSLNNQIDELKKSSDITATPPVKVWKILFILFEHPLYSIYIFYTFFTENAIYLYILHAFYLYIFFNEY
ncbi:uncharacterized protein [Antedon mediterranea]|uniref:uncharacterized protein n=1 Tax=Antedon mediterranea TaxID=105859 RepID=UPI003AF76C6B